MNKKYGVKNRTSKQSRFLGRSRSAASVAIEEVNLMKKI